VDKRLGYVDSVRGFAAIAVIYLHAANHFRLEGAIPGAFELWIVRALTEFSDIGKIAVTLFFAISGFVIPFSLFKPSRHPLRNFAVTRFFRLYPVYWASIFLFVAYVQLMDGTATPLPQILVNLTMLQQFVGVKNVIELFWTLQIELIFYFLCAFLFALGYLRACRHIAIVSAAMLGLAFLLAAARWHFDRKLPVALPWALSIMFWGFLWRRATVEKLPEARALIGKLTLLIYLMIVPIAIFGYSADHGFGETWYRYAASYFAAISLFILFTSRTRITHPAAIFLGRISFSVYLFGPIGQDIAMRLHVFLPAAAPVHLTILLAIACTLPIAFLTYQFIENPGVNLGRRLLRRLDARDEAAAVNIAAAPSERPV
jgi:peptidoglycan/LPS O-acetylase OafA/YrhL